MKKRIMAALLVLTMLLSAVPAMAVDLGNNVGGRDPAQGMNFTTGTVQNKAGAAQKLEVQVKVNRVVASEGVLIYAMVMLTTDYNKLAAGDVSSGTLGTDKFASYAATAGYHAIGSAKVPATGDTVTITLTDKGDASSVVPGDYITVKSFPTQAINASETSYFKDLTLVLFDTHNKAGAASYYVDRFELDYGGYVRTPSYAVRYNDNGGSVTNYTKTPFIVRAASYAALEDTLLTGTTPNQELNSAQGTPKRLGYSFLGWSDEKGATEAKYDSTKGMTLKKPLENALYGVTDVYAVWQTISVHFTDKDKEGLTDDGSARVNEKYTSQTFTLDPSSDPRTAKTYTASGAVYVNGDSTTEPVDAGQLANGLPKGLAFVKDNTTWRIEGTPQFDSDRPIRLTVTVTDGGNGTKDTLTYTFRKIAKGRRPAPELDWNTALQGRKVTAGEAETGQIIGFYSSNAGAPDYKGLTYQYVHKGAYDEAVGKDEDTEALWVNVELPVEAKEGTATEKPAWTTEYGGTVEDATSGDWIKTPPAEGASMPLQISGLKVDTEYYVRFRATETFDASDPVEVTTSGGGGGSTGPADPGAFASITFYDWDGTLLGSIVVTKGEDASAEVQAFVAARTAEASELDPKYLWYSDEKMEADKVDFTKMPKYFSNKKGYDFDTWLLNDSATFTANDLALPMYDGTNDVAAAAAGVADFRNMTENLTVKAAYKGNASLNATAYNAENGTWSGNESRYSITNPIYQRYGNAPNATTGTYSIKVMVKRENTNGFGVTRLQEPALRSVSGSDKSLTGNVEASVYAVVYMSGFDSELVEVVPTKMIAQVTCSVIDAATTNSWPTAGNASLTMALNKDTGGVVGSDGFIRFGTVAFINQQAKLYAHGESHNWGFVNAQAFRDAGITFANANTAKTLIINYFTANPNADDLSVEQLQNIVDGTLY